MKRSYCIILCLGLSVSFLLAQSKTEIKKANQEKMKGYRQMMDSVKIGMAAPDFRYLNIKKDSVQLSSFLGKPVVLFIWDGWCPNGQSQISAFEKMKEKFRWDDVVFITITTEVAKRDWEAYVKKHQLSDIQLWSGGFTKRPAFNYLLKDIETRKAIDPATAETAEFKKAVANGVTIMPVNYVFAVIGPDGKIIENNIPRISDNDRLETVLYNLLDQAKP